MNKLSRWLIGFILFFSIALLIIIWKFLPLWLDEINPLVTNTSRSLLSAIIALLATGGIFYIISREPKPPAEPEMLAETLQKQQQLQAVKINQVVQYLYTAFKLIAQKRFHRLRALPCYLTLHTQNAGMQTFFEKSGLHLYSAENILNQNTSDIHRLLSQWHISDQAVILEADASLTENHTQWLGLLKFLKKFRRFRALNGIIISLNLPELVLQPEAAASEDLKNITILVKSLYQQFKRHIPVYFMLTKVDAIAGFHDFFAHLSASERDQLWGIVFPDHKFLTPQQNLSHVDKAFEKMLLILNQRLFPRLESEKDAHSRSLLSYFPQQMEMCKPALKQIISQTSSLFVRGIYFAGLSTGGKAYDFVMSLLSVRYGLTLPEIHTAASPHAYFTRRIFPEVILKDNEHFKYSAYIQALLDTSSRFRWILAVGLLTIGTLGFSISYAHNAASIDAMNQLLPDYKTAYQNLANSHKTLESPLETLNILKTMRGYFIDSPSPVAAYFLVYEPIHIRHQLNQLWQHMLSTQFMPCVADQLAHILQENKKNPEVLYAALKGYLAFSPIAQSHPEWIKPPFQDYPNPQINQYLDEALQYPVDNLPLNETLIEKIRQQLRKVPPAVFAYHELKTQSENSQQQYNPSQKISGDFNSVFTYRDQNQTAIPLLFTREGFQDLHGRDTKKFILHMAEIYQILGLTHADTTPALATEMSPQIWGFYNQDYIAAWDRYLSNIKITPFTDVNQAVQVLNLLTRPHHNPMQEILQLTAKNTFTVRARHVTVADHFSELNAFTRIPEKPSAQYRALMKNLTALRDYLSNISTSPNPAQAEFQDANAYLQNKLPNNPIALLKRQAQQLPSPVNQWVNGIADNSFTLLLQGAHQVINTAWQNTIMPIYQSNIQNKFPFSKQTDNTVSLNNFGDFFGNGGLFQQFSQTYLLPFMNAGIFTHAAVSQFERAAKIRAMYFPNNDKTPSVSFFIQPRVLDLQSTSVYIQLANQNFIYRHGPQQSFNWHWPALGDTQQVSVTFNDFSSKTTSLSQSGPWAWFTLMNNTTLEPAGSPGHYVWTINQNNHQASFDLWTANNMPVFSLNILQDFNLPPEI